MESVRSAIMAEFGSLSARSVVVLKEILLSGTSLKVLRSWTVDIAKTRLVFTWKGNPTTENICVDFILEQYDDKGKTVYSEKVALSSN
jgi:hypothetical protein